jgi:hypothetical protein
MFKPPTASPIDPFVASTSQVEFVKDRRRPGRKQDVRPALISLLRNPTAGVIAGDLAPIDRFQIVAAWVASAYPADVWRSMSATERSEVIHREIRDLNAVWAARNSTS